MRLGKTLVLLGVVAGMPLALTDIISAKDLLTPDEMRSIRGGACDDCVAGWVVKPVEGLECAHGPEYDEDCPPNGFEPTLGDFGEYVCAEWSFFDPINPADPDTDGDDWCYCMECGEDDGCEGQIRYREAYCGAESETNCGSCEREVDAYNQVIRESRSASPTPGQTCNYTNPDTGEDNGYDTSWDCGRAGGKNRFSCVSQNCSAQGAWGNGKLGTKYKCKE